MVVYTALVVGLGMDTLVVGECRAIGMGLVLGIVSCWDPRNRMYSLLLAMDSPLDELKCKLVLLTLG